MRFPHRTTALLFALGLVGCAGAPTLDQKLTYSPPRWTPEPNLIVKAQTHETTTWEQVDSAGLLVYRVHLPLSDPDNWAESHNLADATAWQGYIIAALAFKAAAIRTQSPGDYTAVMADVNAKIQKLAGVFPYFYNLTGQPGLIGRSLLPTYTGTVPLPWMGPVDESRWVRSSANGEWWLNRPNKDQVNMACVGLGIALALDRKGDIQLSAAAEQALIDALVPMVRRVVNDGYLVLDAQGNKTKHPDFTPNAALIFPNGFNRVMALQLLAGAAPYDSALQTEYEAKLPSWGTGYAWTLCLSGSWTRGRGHWKRSGNVGSSDAQAFAMSACSFLLQENRADYVKTAKKGLEGWWRFMKHEPNGVYTPIYAHFVETDPQQKAALMQGVLAELRDFPPVKMQSPPNSQLTPKLVQPIHNRVVDVNYWKANPFLQMPPTPATTNRRAAGMDYLLSYWMSRYFGLIADTPSGQ